MKILLLALFVCPVAFAQVSQVNIQNFNFKYTAPLGEGFADTFSYQQKEMNDSQKVLVEKIGDDFNVKLEGVENREFIFSNPPDLMKNAHDITLSGFNLNFNEAVSLSMTRGIFNSPDKSVDLKNLTLGCARVASFPTVIDQVLSGCIQKMSLKSSGFSSKGESGFDQALMKAIDESHDEILGGVSIKNIDLRVNSGKFELSADVKAQISGEAKASGSMKYDQPTKKLTVKLSEIKFGFLDVTSKVFDELKKQESNSFKVSKPYLYITIE